MDAMESLAEQVVMVLAPAFTPTAKQCGSIWMPKMALMAEMANQAKALLTAISQRLPTMSLAQQEDPAELEVPRGMADQVAILPFTSMTCQTCEIFMSPLAPDKGAAPVEKAVAEKAAIAKPHRGLPTLATAFKSPTARLKIFVKTLHFPASMAHSAMMAITLPALDKWALLADSRSFTARTIRKQTIRASPQNFRTG
jgi:hypothetical protein